MNRFPLFSTELLTTRSHFSLSFFLSQNVIIRDPSVNQTLKKVCLNSALSIQSDLLGFKSPFFNLTPRCFAGDNEQSALEPKWLKSPFDVRTMTRESRITSASLCRTSGWQSLCYFRPTVGWPRHMRSQPPRASLPRWLIDASSLHRWVIWLFCCHCSRLLHCSSTALSSTL